ncbi:hypothetical protein [Mucilaginibacter sp.]|uniref:hypothetical protein n=1 Tax=Mucilaginibacter sp. TaxID=1882438 RepID=UPI00285076F8|nr:hypothetical protein [Mucilaginibacter sp.]MDR3694266.1 hypothetical protein [Mucilaginibacter sp.]
MISKVLNLIKTNLLGIAVALGIITFLYEGLVKYNSSYVLTKYAAVLIVFVAIYNKYNDNLIDQKPLPKGKYDLNWGILKRYLIKRLKDMPVQILIFAVLYFVVDNKSYAYEYTGLWFLGFVEGFLGFAKRQNYLTSLAEKGLTEKQVNEQEFVKQWEENRERGLIKYCIVDGGIIAGALLSFPVSAVYYMILAQNNQKPFADGPGEMFQLIGVTYLIGAAIGLISYRITWSIKQKKYGQLIEVSH